MSCDYRRKNLFDQLANLAQNLPVEHRPLVAANGRMVDISSTNLEGLFNSANNKISFSQLPKEKQDEIVKKAADMMTLFDSMEIPRPSHSKKEDPILGSMPRISTLPGYAAIYDTLNKSPNFRAALLLNNIRKKVNASVVTTNSKPNDTYAHNNITPKDLNEIVSSSPEYPQLLLSAREIARNQLIQQTGPQDLFDERRPVPQQINEMIDGAFDRLMQEEDPKNSTLSSIPLSQILNAMSKVPSGVVTKLPADKTAAEEPPKSGLPPQTRGETAEEIKKHRAFTAAIMASGSVIESFYPINRNSEEAESIFLPDLSQVLASVTKDETGKKILSLLKSSGFSSPYTPEELSATARALDGAIAASALFNPRIAVVKGLAVDMIVGLLDYKRYSDAICLQKDMSWKNVSGLVTSRIALGATIACQLFLSSRPENELPAAFGLIRPAIRYTNLKYVLGLAFKSPSQGLDYITKVTTKIKSPSGCQGSAYSSPSYYSSSYSPTASTSFSPPTASSTPATTTPSSAAPQTPSTKADILIGTIRCPRCGQFANPDTHDCPNVDKAEALKPYNTKITSLTERTFEVNASEHPDAKPWKLSLNEYKKRNQGRELSDDELEEEQAERILKAIEQGVINGPEEIHPTIFWNLEEISNHFEGVTHECESCGAVFYIDDDHECERPGLYSFEDYVNLPQNKNASLSVLRKEHEKDVYDFVGSILEDAEGDDDVVFPPAYADYPELVSYFGIVVCPRCKRIHKEDKCGLDDDLLTKPMEYLIADYSNQDPTTLKDMQYAAIEKAFRDKQAVPSHVAYSYPELIEKHKLWTCNKCGAVDDRNLHECTDYPMTPDRRGRNLHAIETIPPEQALIGPAASEPLKKLQDIVWGENTFFTDGMLIINLKFSNHPTGREVRQALIDKAYADPHASSKTSKSRIQEMIDTYAKKSENLRPVMFLGCTTERENHKTSLEVAHITLGNIHVALDAKRLKAIKELTDFDQIRIDPSEFFDNTGKVKDGGVVICYKNNEIAGVLMSLRDIYPIQL
ncbi:MAG: hypothetical protein AB9888_13025 [Bacteroidales bacterium]